TFFTTNNHHTISYLYYLPSQTQARDPVLTPNKKALTFKPGIYWIRCKSWGLRKKFSQSEQKKGLISYS
ncbi:hypothetical protein VSP20_13040, partial [Myroides phaeus]|uniref:hypothetical protein n=1 Tax=Myroides phaeus TaxID=702745 RepID=UPI002DB90A42